MELVSFFSFFSSLSMQHHAGEKKHTDSNNGDGNTLVTASDGQESTVGGVAEEVGGDGLGGGGRINTVQGSGEDHGTGWVTDGQNSVGELTTLDSDVAICEVRQGAMRKVVSEWGWGRG